MKHLLLDIGAAFIVHAKTIFICRYKLDYFPKNAFRHLPLLSYLQPS